MKRVALVLLLLACRGLAATESPDFNAACALYARGRYAEAGTAFEHLSTSERDSAQGLYYRGKLAVHRHAYDRAIELLTRAAEFAPNDANIQLWLGNSHAWSASVAEGFKDQVSHGRRALAAYRRAVELDPDNIPARFSLMNFYRHVPAMLGGGMNRTKEQVAAIAKLDRLSGDYASALLAFHEKQYTTALTAAQAILAQHPDHYGANFLLGRIAAASRQWIIEGRAGLQHCLQMTPGECDDPHEAVHELLKQLDAAGKTAVPKSAP